MNLPDVVLAVYPVPLDEPLPNDDFWKKISEDLRSKYKNKDLREFVFDLWENRCDADLIMKMVGMTEDELDAIIPRSKWLVSKWVKCPRCDGRGGKSIKILWSKR